MAAMLVLWTVAGVGILVSLLLGHFTGREYLGYHPFFSLLIAAGWILFAINFYAKVGTSLRDRPPTEPPSPELASRLAASEQSVAKLASSARHSLEVRLREVRRLRDATARYRPARSGLPAFVSKSI